MPLIINNKYLFDGNLKDAKENYNLTPECLCKLYIEKVPDCIVEMFYSDLEVIENFNQV